MLSKTLDIYVVSAEKIVVVTFTRMTDNDSDLGRHDLKQYNLFGENCL